MHTTTGWGWLLTNEGAWCLTTLPTGWFQHGLHLECKLSKAAQCKSTHWKHVPFSRNSQKVVLEGWDCWASCQGLNPSLCWCHLTISCLQLCSAYVSCRVFLGGWNELSMNSGDILEMFLTFSQESSVFSLKMYFICIWGVDGLLCWPIGSMSQATSNSHSKFFLPDKYKCTTLGVGIPSKLEFQLPLKVPKTNFEELLKCQTSF